MRDTIRSLKKDRRTYFVVIALFGLVAATILARQVQTFVRYAQTNGVVMGFTPSSNTVLVGDNFTVSVYLNTNENVTAADFSIEYDPTLLNLISYSEGDILQQVLLTPAKSTGKIRFTQGVTCASGRCNVYSGTGGTLLNMTFNALKSGSGKISIKPPDTTSNIIKVASLNNPVEGDIAVNAYDFDINITSPTPTPTPIARATLTPTPTPQTENISVAALMLVNADNDTDLFALSDGQVVNLNLLPTTNLNIRAVTNGTVGSVVFNYNGTNAYRVEDNAPYSLFGDDGGDFRPWTPQDSDQMVTAIPYSQKGGSGTIGQQLLISFVITGAPQYFTADYFKGTNFNSYVYRETDIFPLYFDWGNGSPSNSINVNNFSVRYEGDFIFQNGNYEFITKSDDGVRLYVDNSLIIDDWITHKVREKRNVIFLNSGVHNVKLEYFEGKGSAFISLKWEKR
jgi:hypothetical protein